MPRTLLVHAHLTVPDNDGRGVPRLVAAVEQALNVSRKIGERGLTFEVIAAEIVYGKDEPHA